MDYSELVGIPYDRANCWEVVVLFYKKVFGLELDHYYRGKEMPRADVAFLIKINKGYFMEADKPEFGDIILLKMYGLECHIGVYLGGNKFLHTQKRIGSHVESLTKWRHNIVGYYRVREDA